MALVGTTYKRMQCWYCNDLTKHLRMYESKTEQWFLCEQCGATTVPSGNIAPRYSWTESEKITHCANIWCRNRIEL